MASGFYDRYKEDQITRGNSITMEQPPYTISAILVDSGYTFASSHSFFSHLTNTHGDDGDARANAVALSANAISTAGIVTQNSELIFDDVTGTNINAMVLFWEQGSDAASSLLAYLELVDAVTAPAKLTVKLTFAAGGLWVYA